MKIKKSQLIELIKEEIMSEMRDLTMMDDPYDDIMDDPRLAAEYPEIGEANKIVKMVMEMAGGDKARAMEMLRNAIGSIRGAMDVENEPMMEGFENITPADVRDVLAGLQKLLTSPYTGPMIAAAFAAVGVEGIRDILSKQKQGGDNDG
jgi:hypothetical protein